MTMSDGRTLGSGADAAGGRPQWMVERAARMRQLQQSGGGAAAAAPPPPPPPGDAEEEARQEAAEKAEVQRQKQAAAAAAAAAARRALPAADPAAAARSDALGGRPQRAASEAAGLAQPRPAAAAPPQPPAAAPQPEEPMDVDEELDEGILQDAMAAIVADLAVRSAPWDCAKCTYRNLGGSTACETCGAAPPPSGAQQQPIQVDTYPPVALAFEEACAAVEQGGSLAGCQLVDGSLAHWSVLVRVPQGCELQKGLELWASVLQLPGRADTVELRMHFAPDFPVTPPEVWVHEPRLESRSGECLQVSFDGRMYLSCLGPPTGRFGGWDSRRPASAPDIVADACAHLLAAARVDSELAYSCQLGEAGPTHAYPGRCLSEDLDEDRQRLGTVDRGPDAVCTAKGAMEVYEAFTPKELEDFEAQDRIAVHPDLLREVQWDFQTREGDAVRVTLELSTALGRRRLCGVTPIHVAAPAGCVLLPASVHADLFRPSKVRVRQVCPRSAAGVTLQPHAPAFSAALAAEARRRGTPGDKALALAMQQGAGVSGLAERTSVELRLGDAEAPHRVFVRRTDPAGLCALRDEWREEWKLELKVLPAPHESEPTAKDLRWAEVAARRRRLLGGAVAAAREKREKEAERAQQRRAEAHHAEREALLRRFPDAGEAGDLRVKIVVGGGDEEIVAKFPTDAPCAAVAACVLAKSKAAAQRLLLRNDIVLLGCTGPRRERLTDDAPLRPWNGARIVVELTAAPPGETEETGAPAPAPLPGGGPPEDAPCPCAAWAWRAAFGDNHPNVRFGKYFSEPPRLVTSSDQQETSGLYQRVSKQPSPLVTKITVCREAAEGFADAALQSRGLGRFGVLYGRAQGSVTVVDAIFTPRQERLPGDFVPLADAEGLQRADRVAELLGMRRIGVAFGVPPERHLIPDMDGNMLTAKEVLLLMRETALYGVHCSALAFSTAPEGAGGNVEIRAFQVSGQGVTLFREGILSPGEAPAQLRSCRTLEAVPPRSEVRKQTQTVDTSWFLVRAGLPCDICNGSGGSCGGCRGVGVTPVEWLDPSEQCCGSRFALGMDAAREGRGGMVRHAELYLKHPSRARLPLTALRDFQWLLWLGAALDLEHDVARICRGEDVRDISALLHVLVLGEQPGCAADFGPTAASSLRAPPQTERARTDTEVAWHMALRQWARARLQGSSGGDKSVRRAPVHRDAGVWDCGICPLTAISPSEAVCPACGAGTPGGGVTPQAAAAAMAMLGPPAPRPWTCAVCTLQDIPPTEATCPTCGIGTPEHAPPAQRPAGVRPRPPQQQQRRFGAAPAPARAAAAAAPPASPWDCPFCTVTGIPATATVCPTCGVGSPGLSRHVAARRRSGD
eukprot:TRINITY_DN18296_c2_g1_i1.p1 TRINITY_DN18296_c2_g1~~TRINITY_DN18296_c2_g1_i1.p1  ORF type:complete len:1362 (+),score=393.72 TRINITY_DN18296_c2_g1_i1:95-4180(+)